MPEKTKTYSQNPFIDQLRKNLIEIAFDPDFQIEQLIEVMNMSRSSLHRKIKANSGLSISLYIRAFRLEKAKILLKTTQSPIKKIAFKVGFSDIAYFSKCFKAQYGLSPKNIRQASKAAIR